MTIEIQTGRREGGVRVERVQRPFRVVFGIEVKPDERRDDGETERLVTNRMRRSEVIYLRVNSRTLKGRERLETIMGMKIE